MPTLDQQAETFVVNAKNPKAKALVEDLRAALKKYGQHKQGCGRFTTWPFVICTCGFDRIVKEG